VLLPPETHSGTIFSGASKFDFSLRLASTGLVWSGLVWSGLVWSGLVWSGLVWSGLVWSGLVWSGLVWSGLVWSGLVWSGLVWSGVMPQASLLSHLLSRRLVSSCSLFWPQLFIHSFIHGTTQRILSTCVPRGVEKTLDIICPPIAWLNCHDFISIQDQSRNGTRNLVESWELSTDLSTDSVET
jgi:hypothetical protein